MSSNIEQLLMAMGYKYVLSCLASYLPTHTSFSFPCAPLTLSIGLNFKRFKYEYVTDIYRYHVLPTRAENPFYVHLIKLYKVCPLPSFLSSSLSSSILSAFLVTSFLRSSGLHSNLHKKERDQDATDQLPQMIRDWGIEVFGYARDTDVHIVCHELHAFANKLIP